jgi:secondary thiamine-phosphate synthase enzyme
MQWLKSEIQVKTPGRGLHDVTDAVAKEVINFGMKEGMLFLNLQHTSAGLCISENYDPTAKRDLEQFLERIAPDGESWHEHTLEGEDDSPSHMRSVVTGVSLSLPIESGKPLLGTWQGIYLCEHRREPHRRTLSVRALKVG